MNGTPKHLTLQKVHALGLGCEGGGEAVSASGGVHYCPLEEAGPTGRGPDGVTVGAESEAAALAVGVSEQRRCSLS